MEGGIKEAPGHRPGRPLALPVCRAAGACLSLRGKEANERPPGHRDGRWSEGAMKEAGMARWRLQAAASITSTPSACRTTSLPARLCPLSD